MYRKFFSLPHIALTAVTLVASLFSSANATEKMAVHYEGIADGDTLYVRDTTARSSLRVRLAMIDAPEKNQQYGRQATETLRQLMRGSGRVILEVHGHDRYGRLIAIVQNEAGQNVNHALVEQGAAWVYDQYASDPSYAERYPALVKAQAEAQEKKLGLWADDQPTPPWAFRRIKQQQ